MTAQNSRISQNAIVISICTLVLIAVISWVGRTVSQTHDSVIKLETNAVTTEKSVSDIKATMLTRADLSIELLKLQVPVKLEKK